MTNKVRVLVVDDSVVFRKQIQLALERSPHIEVVGTANNGKIAIQKLAQLSVDLVTLDMEMPEMGGLETISAIKKEGFKVRIIIFSSQTQRGSEAALSALALGADDFLAKPELIAQNAFPPEERIATDLIPKVLQFEQSIQSIKSSLIHEKVPKNKVVSEIYKKHDLNSFRPGVIVIGSSTGGPQTLEKVLTKLNAPTRCPILIAQHMPPVFTASLAKRLGETAGVVCAEGKDGEELMPNRIYVAPGDFHMQLKKTDKNIVIELDKSPPRNSVRPSVDPLFESAAKIFHSNCFGIVLTGMGEDGLIGCRAIKNNGGCVAIQDKESCVVFGMPGAVFSDGCFDQIKGPDQLLQLIRRMVTPLGT